MPARSDDPVLTFMHWAQIPIGIAALVLAIYWFARVEIALGVIVGVLGCVAAAVAISRLRRE
jgi:hypothetical protein